MDWDAYDYHAPSGSWIAKDFVHGAGFDHGLQCIIDPDVVVGDDVKLGHRVHLASGTRFLNDVEFADDCITTGICILGDHVRVRTGSCISKSVIVDDWAFVAAGIMSSHTKNIHHARPRAPKRQLSTRYGYGSHVVLDLDTPNGVYFNDPHPYATLQRVLEPDSPYYVEIPAGYEPHQFDPDMLAKYLPFARA